MSYRYGTRPSMGSVVEVRQEAEFEWSVRDFLSLVPHTLDSPAFSFLGHPFYLRMVWNNDSAGFIAVSLHPKEGVLEGVSLSVGLGLRKCDGSVYDKQTSRRTFERERQWTECAISWNMSNVREEQEELLQGGALVVVCSLVKKNEEHPHANRIVDLENLSARLKELYVSQSHCDVTIRVQGVEFRAHLPILCAGSPVLAAAFEHPTTERETGVLVVDDFAPETFAAFLAYLYAGRVEEGAVASFEEARALYVAADKYGATGELKSLCVAHMTRALGVESVCDAARFCDLFPAETGLAADAQRFFNRNARAVFSSPEWEELLRSDCRLANKLLREMASKVRIVC